MPLKRRVVPLTAFPLDRDDGVCVELLKLLDALFAARKFGTFDAQSHGRRSVVEPSVTEHPEEFADDVTRRGIPRELLAYLG